jgi:hypothetical protein
MFFAARISCNHKTMSSLKIAIVLSLSSILPGASASTAMGATSAFQEQMRGSAGVLITDQTTGYEAGLWIAFPHRRASQLVGREWSPLALDARGTVAAVPARSRGGALPALRRREFALLRGARIRRIRTIGRPLCARWSADGRGLALLTGRVVAYNGLYPGAPFGIRGTLWILRLDARAKPHGLIRVASGVFPTTVCPAWSTIGRSLAYVVRVKRDPWRLRLFSGGRSQDIVRLRSSVPSVSDNNFAWDPRNESLVFVDEFALYRFADGRVQPLPLSEEAIAAFKESIMRGYSADRRQCRFSPSGELLTVGIANATAVLHARGRVIRVLDTKFTGWAGERGVLTVGLDRSGIVTLFLTTPTASGAPWALERKFKESVVTDPGAGWFAYIDRLREAIVFRRPDGEVISKRAFAFAPEVLGARSARGTISPPVPESL